MLDVYQLGIGEARYIHASKNDEGRIVKLTREQIIKKFNGKVWLIDIKNQRPYYLFPDESPALC